MNESETTIAGISFDLFGTLVSVEKPDDPAEAIATELESRGLSVPSDWNAAYTESHIDCPAGRERSLPDHVAAAVASRFEDDRPIDVHTEATHAVMAAFETDVQTRPGAIRAVERLGTHVPVGVLSNCAVPTLAERVLHRAAIDETAFEATVTSIECGWRKPHPNSFNAVADKLGVGINELLHVGDNPATDGCADRVGATSRLVSEVALTDLPANLEEEWD